MEGPPGIPGGPFFFPHSYLCNIPVAYERFPYTPHQQTDSTKRVDEASPSATLRFQCLGMMAKMVIDKGADEVIAVIVARLNTQRQRMIRRVCS